MLSYAEVINFSRDLVKTPLTLMVMLIATTTYAIIQIYGVDGISSWLITPIASNLLDITKFWKAISPIFIHYTAVHLSVNLYLWWLFSNQLEKHNAYLLILFVLAAATISNLCQLWLTGYKFGGLSGVVFALAAFAWILERLKPALNLRCDNTMAAMLVITLIAAATGVLGNFSNGAHVSGLLFGLITGWVYSFYHKNL